MYITQQLFLYFKVSSLNSGRCRIHTSFFPSEGSVASLLPFAQQRSLVAAHQTPHRNQTNTRQQSALEKKNSREIRLMRGLHSQRALEPSYSPLLWAQAFFLFFFCVQELPVDSSRLNILQMRPSGQGEVLSCYGRSQPRRPPTVPAIVVPASRSEIADGGTQGLGAELTNVSAYSEQPSGNLAAQHFCKHPSDLSHAAWSGNERPILVNELGNAGLPRSRKSVAGEVTGSAGSSPLSQPQNFLPPLTITYVGFLNSFFLHSCLNSTGKRKRRLDVEN